MQTLKEYEFRCKGCGKILDMRDISILSHGWIEDGIIICYEEKPIEYSSSMKVGESIQWTSNKTPIHLN